MVRNALFALGLCAGLTVVGARAQNPVVQLEVTEVVGSVQRPQGSVVLVRSRAQTQDSRLETSFTTKVVSSVRTHPF